MGKTVGIDLGTTFSLIAFVDPATGEPRCIPGPYGETLCPSVVSLDANGTVVAGEPARRRLLTQSNRTIYSVKRLMGRGVDDIRNDLKLYPFRIDEESRGMIRVKLGDKYFTPPEVSAFILRELKSWAEDFFKDTVDRAVITVPAYFNDAQRQATKQAGEIAGLEVLRIINEPTAAALAYGLDKKKDETIAVYDLGGGTFDISILEVGEGVVEVKSTNGDTHLGGDDIDQHIVDWMIAEFKKEQGIDLSKDRMAIQRLKEAAEKAKIELSQLVETEINLPFVTANESGPKHMQLKLTRAKLEQLMEDLLQRTVGPVKQALSDAGVTPDKIDEVVLVGGSTRIPRVVDIVKNLFNGKEPHKGVNPDEVVAVGAAIQGGVLGGEVKDILLLDVTPLSLGVETMGGVMTVLIPRNTTIPTRKAEMFSTASDNQTSVEIHVLQGERPVAAGNRTLGKFHLIGLPPAPRGLPQVEVTFDIDANGILNVSAKDMATNKEQKITITASSGLSKEEAEKMRKEAESHSDEDKAKIAEAEARNRCDNLVYQTEKLIRENRDKLAEADVKAAEEAVEAAKRALAEGGADRLNQAAEELTKASHKLAEAMYKATSAAGAAAGGQGGATAGPGASPDGNPSATSGSSTHGQGDVVDAEFVDVDESKKPN